MRSNCLMPVAVALLMTLSACSSNPAKEPPPREAPRVKVQRQIQTELLDPAPAFPQPDPMMGGMTEEDMAREALRLYNDAGVAFADLAIRFKALQEWATKEISDGSMDR